MRVDDIRFWYARNGLVAATPTPDAYCRFIGRCTACDRMACGVGTSEEAAIEQLERTALSPCRHGRGLRSWFWRLRIRLGLLRRGGGWINGRDLK